MLLKVSPMPDNFKFTETDFENSVLELFQTKHPEYRYKCGYEISRTAEEILLKDDFCEYIAKRYSVKDFGETEIGKIIANLETARGTSLYDTMSTTLETLRDGYTLDRSALEKTDEHIEYFDYDNVANNIFRIVNQYEVKDGAQPRRPDIIVFVNGIPVAVFELKNVTKEIVTIYDAYKQLHIRYKRDIPSLMRYSFLCVLSDGANTKVGSLFADYKHFFPWKSVDGVHYSSNNGVECLLTLVEGLFDPRTLLNVIGNYAYFPDTDNRKSLDLVSKEVMILPKYSQYYASEALFKSIKAHRKPNGDGKGGTYFGATGCGKSYTMLFLARRLSTSRELANPTILLLTDRTDLDDQLSEIFEVSKKFLVDANTKKVSSRKMLYDELRGIQSGGIFLMTVQKFDEDVGLLSDRTNIVCISDEAHRTQVNLDVDYRTVYAESESERGMRMPPKAVGVKKRYGFAKYLRDSFPNATYVGFTGTPIDSTIRVFGPVVMSYKMKQAVDDGSTVSINIQEGPRSVRLDDAKIRIVDKYYEEQIRSGNNVYQVEQSKRDMATVRTIIDNESRLNLVVNHIINHYELRLKEGSTVNGKAMIVCYDRLIAYRVYRKLSVLRPDWFIKKKTQLDESTLTVEQLESLKEVQMVNLIATRNRDDEPELYDLLGDDGYRSSMAKLFKVENSNFKIAIVVDMWMTGFDCESLDTMYIDKPLERHSLIQTISRVNRVFKGKEKGLIVDYIGLEASLAKALQLYGGDDNPVLDTEVSYVIFKDQLQLLDEIMANFDKTPFFTGSDLDRLLTIEKGANFVCRSNETETRFMAISLRMKRAYDLCIGDERITGDEMTRVHLYCGIRSLIFKATDGEKPDAVLMNEEVKRLVDACISAYGDEDDEIKVIDIFSSEYLKKIEGIPYKNTKFQMLIKLLKKAIRQYSKTNKIQSIEFSKRMRILVDKYNNRDGLVLVSNDEVINDFIDGLTAEATKILKDLENDANEFKKLGISFEEKAIYDILKAIRDKYKFEYEDNRMITLAKKVKEIVDDKSKYIDWSSKQDIKASFHSDIIRLLNRNGYPPCTFDDVYNKVLSQVDNIKRNAAD